MNNDSSSKYLRDIKNRGTKGNHGKFHFITLTNPKETLISLVNHGYVLHGSSRKIEGALLPRQAYDSSKKFGNQVAVYLTKDPLLAMFTALCGGVEGITARRNSIRSTMDDKGRMNYTKTYFAVDNPELIKDKGYVYVFPVDVVDENQSNESIAKTPINPQLIIQIDKEDFPEKIQKIRD